MQLLGGKKDLKIWRRLTEKLETVLPLGLSFTPDIRRFERDNIHSLEFAFPINQTVFSLFFGTQTGSLDYTLRNENGFEKNDPYRQIACGLSDEIYGSRKLTEWLKAEDKLQRFVDHLHYSIVGLDRCYLLDHARQRLSETMGFSERLGWDTFHAPPDFEQVSSIYSLDMNRIRSGLYRNPGTDDWDWDLQDEQKKPADMALTIGLSPNYNENGYNHYLVVTPQYDDIAQKCFFQLAHFMAQVETDHQGCWREVLLETDDLDLLARKARHRQYKHIRRLGNEKIPVPNEKPISKKDLARERLEQCFESFVSSTEFVVSDFLAVHVNREGAVRAEFKGNYFFEMAPVFPMAKSPDLPKFSELAKQTWRWTYNSNLPVPAVKECAIKVAPLIKDETVATFYLNSSKPRVLMNPHARIQDQTRLILHLLPRR